MCLENRWTVTPPALRSSLRGSRWSRPLSALALVALLGGSLASCDDFDDDGDGRRGRFGWDDDRGERRGWDRDGRRWWERGRDRDRDGPDAAAGAVDAGNVATDAGDAGTATNAGNADAAAPAAGEDLLDAGTADAAPPTGAAALSDAQILLVADTLLADAIRFAQAALPRLAEPEAVGAAEALIDENAAARNTLAAVGDAIDAPTDEASAGSDLAAAVAADGSALVAGLSGPDAGALDALYLDAALGANAQSLALVGELAAAADAPALRAQLVVIETLLALQRERTQGVAAAL